ncbi:MAG TPA: hypothetical protein VK797_23375 [Tepidisphaeraceae bacterium]|jgi:hypothetical protein|nr:hypothetical protein [Tepidisphaeraceae bacterium]
MSKFGKEIIAGLKWLNHAIKNDLPVKQTIIRRMKVKGKTVYTDETFTAPVRRMK